MIKHTFENWRHEIRYMGECSAKKQQMRQYVRLKGKLN